MADLITTLEQLTGPSREVDAQICVALGLFVTRPNPGWPDRIDYGHLGPDGTTTWPGHGFDQLVPRLTASLDAAIALCERVLPGWQWERTVTDTGTFIRLVGPEYIRYQFMGSRNPHMQGSVAVRDRTFYRPDPIALLIALLRAKEASNG